ncbi:peptidylprolyl isomerase [Cohnella fermenti]|uniref:Peptidyl-prolyl cis-trans isomerase n=1 Tax=Cohnella fermenti TaxID=2565925 RepID=A0A4S4BVL2_9BACL|nr:peptidylprolyl isomerase [Cohnella fermenti]THF79144.1 peptidylprolyl isomerase [Cohnella fermenti]
MHSHSRKSIPLLLAAIALISVLLAGCGNDNKKAGAPSGSVDPNASHPVVTIEMDSGKIIKAELYPEVAPITVNNFISLVQKGFYDGLTFHRLYAGFMIQGGDPDGNGTGGPGYSIKGEFANNGVTNKLLHEPGVLSMARSTSPDSAGSQFFIMVSTVDSLDTLYAAFGKVTEGLDVVEELSKQPTVDNGYGELSKPVTAPVMKKVTVDTLGVDYPEPEKITS